jgi:hypothetical protein
VSLPGPAPHAGAASQHEVVQNQVHRGRGVNTGGCSSSLNRDAGADQTQATRRIFSPISNVHGLSNAAGDESNRETIAAKAGMVPLSSGTKVLTSLNVNRRLPPAILIAR